MGLHVGVIALGAVITAAAAPRITATTPPASPTPPSSPPPDATAPPAATAPPVATAPPPPLPALAEALRDLPHDLHDLLAATPPPTATDDPVLAQQHAEERQRQEVLRADDALRERAEADLTASLLAQLDQDTVPALARQLQNTLEQQVLRALAQQVTQTATQERIAALQVRQAATNAARDAWHLVRQAHDQSQKPSTTATALEQPLQRAQKRLAAAPSIVLEWDATQRQAFAAAREAVAAARNAAATPATASAALAQAKTALEAAIAALSAADHHEARVQQALQAAIQHDVLPQVQRQVAEDFRAITLPTLRDTMAARVQAAGVSDAQAIERITTTALTHLAERVPGKVALATAPPAPAAEPAADEAALEQRLSAPRHELTAMAQRRVASAMNGHALTGTIQRLAIPAPSSALVQARERVHALASSLRQGRSGTWDTVAAATAATDLDPRRLVVEGAAVADTAAYHEAARIAATRSVTSSSAWATSPAATEAGPVLSTRPSTGPRVATAIWSPPADARPAKPVTPYQPTFPTLAFTTAPLLPASFTLDGTAEKWAGIEPLTLHPEWGTFPSPATMQMGWRPEGLYLRFCVHDPDRHLTQAPIHRFWDSDNVEVWFDGLNTKATYRSRTTGQHFWVWPLGAQDDARMVGGEARIDARGGPVVTMPWTTQQLPRVATTTATGWTIEFLLPRERLIDAHLAAGRIIGWNAYINTMAGTNWYWSAGKKANTWYQPDTWGDVLLAGSDATLEWVDRTAPLLPGTPLRVRVHDADMDLHADQIDHVPVTIRPAMGAAMTATLTETGPQTGIFTADIPTTWALDTPAPGALPLHAGEALTITYVDLVGARGNRHTPRTLQVITASPVMTTVP